MTFKAQGWALTDVGQKRDHNEDSYLCNDEIALYAVADGMGGHLGGEKASRMAVDVLEQEISRGISLGVTRTNDAIPVPTPGLHPIAKAMRNAVNEATRTIWQTAQVNPQYAGMGTTMTGLIVHRDRVTICHVGDSRAYLYRQGQTRQLTEDHSWIAEQIRAGLVDPDDLIASRFRNIITRSVGFEPTVDPDLMTLPVEAGDCFLLCSDGLSNHVSAEEIGNVLATQFYAEAGQTLIEMANQRGGDDNITVLVVYVSNAP
ncbi:MAG: Stp1/IreP family PP2C-type Ser/Thr phosphatase [Myxococcales bacterium]|nr:Stp1/IreP family PP2C-type Ser/Thr phosphatase [Myxococcales bacterium]